MEYLPCRGDFKDHIKILNKLNVDAVEVRLPEDLSKADGLIIPGGESTTIGKLLLSSGLMAAIIKRCKKGMPIYGTCAGAILLAKNRREFAAKP